MKKKTVRRLLTRINMIFLRNPILIEGIVIATVVMTTTHVLDAMCACLALWIMALPTALIVYPIKEKLPAYAKAIIYALVACVMYIPAYFILKTISQQAIADLTIYLPLLVLSELIMAHSEKSSKHRRFKSYAISTVMDLIGVSLVMFVVSSLREILAYGTFFGITLELNFKLPFLPFRLQCHSRNVNETRSKRSSFGLPSKARTTAARPDGNGRSSLTSTSDSFAPSPAGIVPRPYDTPFPSRTSTEHCFRATTFRRSDAAEREPLK